MNGVSKASADSDMPWKDDLEVSVTRSIHRLIIPRPRHGRVRYPACRFASSFAYVAVVAASSDTPHQWLDVDLVVLTSCRLPPCPPRSLARFPSYS